MLHNVQATREDALALLAGLEETNFSIPKKLFTKKKEILSRHWNQEVVRALPRLGVRREDHVEGARGGGVLGGSLVAV